MVANSACAQTWQVFNETCTNELDPRNSSFNCSSLEKVAGEIEETTNVQIDFKIPRLQLNDTLNLVNLTSLKINGNPETTQITCTKDSFGIILEDITDTVSLQNLKLISCGSEVHHENGIYVSALTIIRCYNVELHEVSISNSNGVGLTFLHHRGGSVNVWSTVFKENKLHREDKNDTVMGGEGVLIKLDQLHGSAEPMSFTFKSCLFENNYANTKYYKSPYTDDMGKQHNRYEKGGGVSVLLKTGLNEVYVSLLYCIFKGTKAIFFSGLEFRILGEL